MAADSPPTFGALLRSYRLDAGLSQAALAERAGLSARAVSALERGARRAPYPHTVRQLASALGLAAPEHARLEGAVRRGRGPAAPRLPAAGPASNLPAPTTSFVGRERELAEVRRLLRETRLLTLTGAGGCGKTRLALETARAVVDRYPDGVWLVELAALADPALVSQAVAGALGVREQPGQPLIDRLAAWLGSRGLLLVLDNCEHLVDACARLADALLRACPELQLLATSREALGVAGEVAWRVPSLVLPDRQRLPTSELARVEAVRLFADRARAVAPDFTLTDQNAPAVAEVCRRLDGIPLAIELAAARVRVLAVEQIAARLDDSFHLLTGGNRTALPRQRTLHATLDWSHALLTDPERIVFRRLAVVAGGWPLEAAEAVGAGGGIAERDVLDLLTRLVDQSLAQAETGGADVARYRLLEPLRQYALERLRSAGEEAPIRDRHAAWCLTLAERAAPALESAEQVAWLARLDAEYDNLRAALAWLQGHDPETGLRLASNLTRYWDLRMRFPEGHRWLERLLARTRAPTVWRVRALHGAGRLGWELAPMRARLQEGLALAQELGARREEALVTRELGQVLRQGGDYRQARARLDEGLALSRAVGDRHGVGTTLQWLSELALAVGDYGQARARLREALPVVQAVGDREMIATILWDMARLALVNGEAEQAQDLLAKALRLAEEASLPTTNAFIRWTQAQAALWLGDMTGAAALFEAGLDLGRAGGHRRLEALCQHGLGRVARLQGEADRATALLQASLAFFTERGDPSQCDTVRHDLALVAWSRGDAPRAAALLRENLARQWERDEPPMVIESLEGLALVAAGQRRPARAARLLAAATAWREALGTPAPLVERSGHEATVAAGRAVLGEAAFAAAWGAGQALPLERAIDEALADEPAAADAATAPSPAADGLSQRADEATA